MKKILIFSGTTEGRKLAELLSDNGIHALVCVATEYGRQVMEPMPLIEIHSGRMDLEKMHLFMENGDFLAVVDATHPFATKVSENIRNCSDKSKVPYFRLKRDTGSREENNATYFSSNEECADVLLSMGGNVLLTTGSKELEYYCKYPELKDRLYVRVLPNEESISTCLKHGITGKHIIAMQGPFSLEMNAAIIKEFDIRILVTKESGEVGGFLEKAEAADKLDIDLFVISNPDNTKGVSFLEVCEELERLTDIRLYKANENIAGHIPELTLQLLAVTLIGVGMGNIKTLTLEAKEEITGADYIFGANRLLTDVRNWDIASPNAKMFPYYLAKDIIPALEELCNNNKKKAVVLFSGDSGFFSGCNNLYKELNEWKKDNSRDVSIKILPGISSVSYFASAVKTSYDGAELFSIHGKSDNDKWRAELLSKVRYCKKIFVLVSGAQDVKNIGALLSYNRLENVRIVVGYRLSYADEKITECSFKECMNIDEEGLYILGIFNDNPEKRYLLPHNDDSAFIRGNVPMTKEEIRHLVICKLKLTDDAIVYDIGSGTGSIAVEIADLNGRIKVFTIEHNSIANGLIRQNKDKFRLPNIEIKQGAAPHVLETLPCPTHAFIGGTNGSLKEILACLYDKNPEMRVVMTAISIETVSEIKDVLNDMPVENEELIQVQVSRSKNAGSHHLMQAENPVYICSFDFKEK